MRLNLPRAMRQLRLPTTLPRAAVILGVGCAVLISLLGLSHGFPPWRTAWLPPSNAKYAICFTVRAGADPIAVAERIAGPTHASAPLRIRTKMCASGNALRFRRAT